MDFYPLFLKLENQPCLVVGGGKVAVRKAEALLSAGADVRLVAPRIDAEITRQVMQGKIRYSRKTFEAADVEGMRLVIAATSDTLVNRAVFNSAEARNILVNATDDLDSCRFIIPAIVDRSPLMIAISSAGKAPVLARLLRQKIETLVPSAYGRLADFAGALRQTVKSRLNNMSSRRRFWESILSGTVAEKVLNDRVDEAHALFCSELNNHASRQHQHTGEVYLIGAGPGDPELVTLKALRLMQQADVVLYDNLVSKPVLDLVRRDAIRVSVGKKKGAHTKSQSAINEELVRLAKQGKRVCRLKGGDPFIFGRGGEELATLLEHDIPFQVVPGITAASGCAAYAGIPLTHRDHADSVTFITGHRKNNGELDLPFANLVSKRQTVVFYMSLSTLPGICADLISHGLSGATPAAAVSQGTSSDQKVIVSSVAQLAEDVSKANLASPTLIIVGDVVQLSAQLSWFGKPESGHKTTTMLHSLHEHDNRVFKITGASLPVETNEEIAVPTFRQHGELAG